MHPLSGTPGLESEAVVGHGEEQPVADLAEGDGRVACSRMASHIAQSLLSDPEQAERGVLGERVRQWAEVRGDVELAPARPPPALRAQRLGQSQLLQDRGVQLVGQGVDVLAQTHEPFADGLHGFCLLSVRGSELGAADLDRQHGEPLAHVVVELAGEQGALLLLGADEAAAQFARLLLGPLAVGHVAEDTVRADGAAAGIARGCARQVLDPALVAVGMQVAILDGEPLLLPLVHLPAQLDHPGAVVRMHVLHPEVEDPEAGDPVGRDAAEVAQPVVRVHRAGVEVHFVERQAGELGPRRQTRLAGGERLLGALALADVDGHAHQPVGLTGGGEVGSSARRDPALAARARRSGNRRRQGLQPCEWTAGWSPAR